MGKADTVACAEHISAETLSAWRDDLLPVAEMRRLTEHAAGCAACQAELARFDEVAQALRRQPELRPGDRIVEGVRRRASPQRGGRALRPRGRGWASARVLAPIAAVAAVLLLFVYVLGMGAGWRRGPAGSPTATMSKAPSPTWTATAGPTPTVPPLSPSASILQAWGPNATQATAITQLDATHVFVARGLTPDGRTLLGYAYTLTSAGAVADTVQAQAGLLDMRTKAFTAIGLATSPQYPPYMFQSDGRYVVAADSNQPGATGGVVHIRLWAYDMLTRQIRVVAVGAQYQAITGAFLSNGLLVMETGMGIQVADLHTRTITPLPENTTQMLVMAYTWPYMVDGSPQVHDLATGQVVALPQPPGVNGSASWGMGITGDTLFYSEATSSMTTLYELDHMLAHGSQWRLVGTFGGDLGGIVGANARVVALSGAVWDRAEKQFVMTGISATSGQGYGVALPYGDYLALFRPYGKGLTPGVQQATVYDTARLLVLSPQP